MAETKLMEYDHGTTQIPDQDGMEEGEEFYEHGDIMSLAEINEYPEIKKLSARNQGVMMAHAYGYSQRAIADMFSMKQPNVCSLIRRIDPNGMFKVSKDAMKAFQTRMMESRAIEMLSYITPEKMKEASAGELTRAATSLFNASAAMNQTKHKSALTGSILDSMAEQIEIERLAKMDKAEVEEQQ